MCDLVQVPHFTQKVLAVVFAAYCCVGGLLHAIQAKPLVNGFPRRTGLERNGDASNLSSMALGAGNRWDSWIIMIIKQLHFQTLLDKTHIQLLTDRIQSAIRHGRYLLQFLDFEKMLFFPYWMVAIWQNLKSEDLMKAGRHQLMRCLGADGLQRNRF